MIKKIKGLRKYSDCSMPSNEKQRTEKAECAAYNTAIDDVLKLFAIPVVRNCPICSAEMKGIKLTHYKCTNCNEYFTD